MNRSVQVYVEGERLELFNDEKISVSSSVQNISDISKVFTDFSQSFTVPASPHNNVIFEHYYNNDLDGFINHNLRRDAWIEIDLIPFRKGKLQLEKANIKNGRAQSYSVTFYGDIRTLKDAFGELKLKDIDLSSYSFLYSGDAVQDRIENNTIDYDVRYPLISSRRLWQWAEPTTPLDNINTIQGALEYDELYPAIRIKSIFDQIQAQFGVTFTGLFLDNQKFKKAFQYCKNKESFELICGPQDLTLSATVITSPTDYFDLINNSLTLTYRDDVYPLTGYPVFVTVLNKHYVSMSIIPDDNNVMWYVDLYIDGLFYQTFNGQGTQTFNMYEKDDIINTDQVLTFQVRSSDIMNISYTIYYRFRWDYIADIGAGVLLPQAFEFIDYAYNNLLSLTGNMNISDYMPDIKIADWFSSLLKLWNLTCYGISEGVFQIEPLEDWYNKGTIYDITQYTTLENIDVERIKLYKRISFEFEKSMSFMNRTYNSFFNIEYGNLNNDFPYDGSDYTIKVPFENIMFNKFDNTDVQVGYCLEPEPDFKPYIPKPIILYFNGFTVKRPYLKKEATTIHLDRSAIFGQDYESGSGAIYSLNWGADTSTYYQTPILNGLYNSYYKNYIENLFTLKNRMIRVKCILPLKILTDLKLNDRLIIRDKRYIINEMNSELTGGEVTFTLISDFRELKKQKPQFDVPSGVIGDPSVTHGVPLLLPNKVWKVAIDITGSGITSVTPTEITEDTIVDFEFPINNDQKYILESEDDEFYVTSEDGFRLINGESKNVYYTALATYYYMDNHIENEQINFTQLPVNYD